MSENPFLGLRRIVFASILFGAGVSTVFAAPNNEPQIAKIIRDWIAKDGPPGVVLAVRQDGKTTFYCYGEANRAKHLPVTADSVFELASITKTFTTTLLALAVDRGQVSLADPASKYLPSLQHGDIAKVTLGQLATHTSGLPRGPRDLPWHSNNQAFTLPDTFRFLQEWKTSRPPGSKFEYSNIGMGIIGYVMETRAKSPLMSLYSSEILQPLGMDSTGIQLTPEMQSRLVQGYGPLGATVSRTTPNAWPAGGAMCSSARDMGKFLAANMGEGKAPAPLLAAMQHTQQGIFRVNPNFVQAWAWQVMHLSNTTVIDKNGDLVGTSTYIGLVPSQHLGLVLLSNRGKRPATMYGRKILLLLAGVAAPGATTETMPSGS